MDFANFFCNRSHNLWGHNTDFTFKNHAFWGHNTDFYIAFWGHNTDFYIINLINRDESWLGLGRTKKTALYPSFFTIQRTFFLWRPFLHDAKDDMILEVAVAARRKAIVTFNGKDFGGAETFGIEILTPHEFLKRLESIAPESF